MRKLFRYNFRELSRILIPPFVAIFLFVFCIFYLFLPLFEQSLLAEKKLVIKELVHTAWHMVEQLDKEVALGKHSLKEAQQTAIDHLREMRYGEENKDYFWINDLTPTLVMHPYRPDLEGENLSDFEDPRGTKLFIEFIKMVTKNREGYVPYMWQWKDDANRIVPKLSYVKEYKPWGWIIGTGIYLKDVETEVAQMTKRLEIFSLFALVFVSLLTWFQIYQALRAIRFRQNAETELSAYKDQLEVKVAERTKELVLANDELKKALSEINTLSGFIPICSSCKGIRDDKGYWNKIESYITTHTEAHFSHSICPDCAKKLYPDDVDANGDIL